MVWQRWLHLKTVALPALPITKKPSVNLHTVGITRIPLIFKLLEDDKDLFVEYFTKILNFM